MKMQRSKSISTKKIGLGYLDIFLLTGVCIAIGKRLITLTMCKYVSNFVFLVSFL